MGFRRQFNCDGPDCASTQFERDAQNPPDHWLTVMWHGPGSSAPLHFCLWDCLLKYGAQQPPVTVIPWDEAE